MCPLYEYNCRRCDKVFEELASFDDYYYECPDCKHMAERQISRCNGKVAGTNTPTKT